MYWSSVGDLHIETYRKFMAAMVDTVVMGQRYGGAWGNCTQRVYNRLLLVPIVGSACFQRHQLAAVFNASFSVIQVTYEISHINRMREEGVFCDAMPTYP